MWHALDHGLTCSQVPGGHVEDPGANGVHVQSAHQRETVDGALCRNWHRVDERDKREALAQGEADDAGAGQHGLCSDLDLRHLHSEAHVNCFVVKLEHRASKFFIACLNSARASLPKACAPSATNNTSNEIYLNAQGTKTDLGELPHSIDGLVVEAERGRDAVGIGGAGHIVDLRLAVVAEGVIVQVVDVGHINGVLKHAPVVAVELDLTIHWAPCWVVQLWHIWDWRPLILWQVLAAIEQPDEATLQAKHGVNSRPDNSQMKPPFQESTRSMSI